MGAPREELVGAVDRARGEQLFAANDAELGAELLADEVLAALAAIEREVGGLGAEAARQPCQELGVFVVGMGADDQHALVGAELPQRVGQRRDAAGPGGSARP